MIEINDIYENRQGEICLIVNVTLGWEKSEPLYDCRIMSGERFGQEYNFWGETLTRQKLSSPFYEKNNPEDMVRELNKEDYPEFML